MRIAAVFLSLAIAAAAPLFATLPQEELRRGLLNLISIEDLSYELRYQRAVHGRMTLPEGPILDPWGTPYRVEINGEKFRIIGAGSDRKFEPESWTTPGQYADLATDVVADDDDITRSNHLWLNRLVPDCTSATPDAQCCCAGRGLPDSRGSSVPSAASGAASGTERLYGTIAAMTVLFARDTARGTPPNPRRRAVQTLIGPTQHALSAQKKSAQELQRKDDDQWPVAASVAFRLDGQQREVAWRQELQEITVEGDLGAPRRIRSRRRSTRRSPHFLCDHERSVSL